MSKLGTAASERDDGCEAEETAARTTCVPLRHFTMPDMPSIRGRPVKNSLT